MFRIDTTSADAPFEQIKHHLTQQIATGALATGARLPPVRGFAADLGVAAGTVARSYQELEQEGVLETRGRAGTFVAATGDPFTQRAAHAAAEYARIVGTLGISAKDAVSIVRTALGVNADAAAEHDQ